MKIILLSRGADRLYSNRSLAAAAEARGHEIDVYNTVQCYMDIASNEPSVHFAGDEIPPADVVIPRIGASITFYGCSVVRQFEMMGTYCLNESVAIARSRDKLRSLQILAKHGIGMPLTGFAHSPGNTKDLINLVGGAPLVVKLLEGTQGKGIVLAETRKAAETTIEAFRQLKANFLVQEFIKEAGGADIRCFVIGQRVVAAMMRSAPPGEFRSNLHRGGVASIVKLTPTERRTAVKAARVLGLNVAGVDILRSDRGPLVMEVNSSPGLEGIENATGKDVAGMIMDFIEKNAKPGKTRTRGKG